MFSLTNLSIHGGQLSARTGNYLNAPLIIEIKQQEGVSFVTNEITLYLDNDALVQKVVAAINEIVAQNPPRVSEPEDKPVLEPEILF